VVIVLPYILPGRSVLPVGAADWLLRITPAAAFAVQQALPQYPQVTATYSPSGYYPLAPWAGFAVLCAWAALAWPGRLPAAPEGRMSQLPASQREARGWACAGRAARGVDQAAHLAGTGWLLLAVIALTVAVGTADGRGDPVPGPGRCQVDPAKLSLTGIDLGQAVVAILAVLAISGEYSTGMIRITLTAMPRRHRRWPPRPPSSPAWCWPRAPSRCSASVLAGRLILPGHGFTPAHGYPLLSLGGRAGAARRRRIGPLPGPDRPAQPRRRHRRPGFRGRHRVVLGLLYLFPIVATSSGTRHWHRHLEQIGPMTAGLAIQATTGLRSLPISPWAGLGVLAAWAAAALLAGGLLLRLRDA
jgi:ABC-2 type transport system permease protein